MRAALLSVKGVAQAHVTYETKEAVVTYDATQASVDDLLKAVADAEGPVRFRARVKESP